MDIVICLRAADCAAIDHAAQGGGRVQGMADHSAVMGFVGSDSVVQTHIGRHVDILNRVGAFGKAYQCGAVLSAGNATCQCQVLDGGAVDIGECGCTIRAVVDGDGQRLGAAIVGAAEAIGLAGAYRGEVAVGRDVGGLAEGLSAALGAAVDGCGQVVPVGRSGNLVGGGASLVGGEEELAAQRGANLFSVISPITSSVGQDAGRCGEGNVLQVGGVEVVVVAAIEVDGTGVVDIDGGKSLTVLEGRVVDGVDAGGKGDGGHLVAVVDGGDADARHAVANGDALYALCANEGVVADASDAIVYDDGGDI